MNSKTWVCQNGCKMDKVPCKHLENLLPRLSDGKVTQETMGGYSIKYGETTSLDEYERQCNDLEGNLSEAGFNPTETHLIMDRFVSGLSIKELSKKYGATDSVIVNRLDSILTELKKHENIFLTEKEDFSLRLIDGY